MDVPDQKSSAKVMYRAVQLTYSLPADSRDGRVAHKHTCPALHPPGEHVVQFP